MSFRVLFFDTHDNIANLKNMEIAWESYDIRAVSFVTDYNEACSLILANRVDIVFCNFGEDNEAGIRLAQMMEDIPKVFLVILIYEKEGEFSRPVLKYSSNWEYMFMPVGKEELSRSLRRITSFVLSVSDAAVVSELGYSFIRNINVYQELFWKDLLNDIIPPGRANALEIAAQRKIRIPENGFFILRMRGMSDRKVMKEWSKRDKMTAVRNLFVSIFDEYLLSTVFDDEYNLTIILENIGNYTRRNRDEISKKCSKLVEIVQRNMGICYLICMSRNCLNIEEVFEKNKILCKKINRFTGGISAVIYDDDDSFEGQQTLSAARYLKWEMLVEHGAFDALRTELHDYMARVENTITTRDVLYDFLFRFWKLLIDTVNLIDFGIEEAVKILLGHPIGTIDELKMFCDNMIEKAKPACSVGDEAKDLVEMVKIYVRDHISTELGRDEIAENIGYHPDYISRVFHEYTGETLTGYIQSEKIKRAIFLFTETSMSVGQVAERLGYTNFSYFSQLFRKITGYTVRDYKKRYLAIEGERNRLMLL